MSLESDRRAIGTALTASRSAISTSMQASRASTFKRDLNALESGTRKTTNLSAVEVRGARAATRGMSVYTPPSSTGGIASPLTEVEVGGVGDRTFHDSVIITTTDGLFSFEVQPIKTWKFTDADGNAVLMNIAIPPEVA